MCVYMGIYIYVAHMYVTCVCVHLRAQVCCLKFSLCLSSTLFLEAGFSIKPRVHLVSLDSSLCLTRLKLPHAASIWI